MLVENSASQTQTSFELPRNGPEIADTKILVSAKDAAASIAPMWDLRDSVAVNPFFSMRDQPALLQFKKWSNLLETDLLPSVSYFKEKWETRQIAPEDLGFALEKAKRSVQAGWSGALLSLSPEDLILGLNQDYSITTPSDSRMNRSYAKIFSRLKSVDASQWVIQEVSKWMGAYFDEGQALWRFPYRQQRVWNAFKNIYEHDASLRRLGVPFRQVFQNLPDHPEEAIVEMVKKQVPGEWLFHPDLLVSYFQHLLGMVLGWASVLSKVEFEAHRTGDFSELERVGGVVDLLAVVLAFESALAQAIPEDHSRLEACFFEENREHQLEFRYVWLLALEQAYRRVELSKVVYANESAAPEIQAQLVFCIDVRSEVIRRQIENTSSKIQTIGFAGFFGLPISHRGVSHDQSVQQCPVLLNPAYCITDAVRTDASGLRLTDLEFKKRQAAQDWNTENRVKKSANSSFSFVETLGAGYFFKMLRSALGWSGTTSNINHLGLRENEVKLLRPQVEHLSPESKISLAYGALKNMGLLSHFAKWIVFFGHQATSTNNPYAASLDCGACAGHSGETNARVLAAILNESSIRTALFELYGIQIPATTRFLAGVHNTTLDRLTFYDIDQLGNEDQTEWMELRSILDVAERKTIEERTAKLSMFGETTDPFKEIHRKATDWSEVRPEWALAGNASFVVGKRSRFRGVNLGGRAFLHDYDFKKDLDLTVLELIMTAPMIVTNWINLQYYASAVAPHRLGSGNKTTHNVVGALGVMQGNLSDLQVGLSYQSVARSGQLVHQPMRLQVLIEAPRAGIESIIGKHQMVHELVTNEWLIVLSLDPETGKVAMREAAGWRDLDYSCVQEESLLGAKHWICG